MTEETKSTTQTKELFLLSESREVSESNLIVWKTTRAPASLMIF